MVNLLVLNGAIKLSVTLMDALIGACFIVRDVQIFRSSHAHFNQTISNKMTKGFKVIIKITKVD